MEKADVVNIKVPKGLHGFPSVQVVHKTSRCKYSSRPIPQSKTYAYESIKSSSFLYSPLQCSKVAKFHATHYVLILKLF